MTTREQLRAIIDELPEDEVPVALHVLRGLRALAAEPPEVPDDDEPLTDDDRAALAEAWDDVAAGRVVSHEEVRRESREAP
ncbi:MAG: hypothetical protein HZB15_02550 [Actinobacteria bacterium]|nr:hypothetical protein [Actinomycetota bacterium]